MKQTRDHKADTRTPFLTVSGLVASAIGAYQCLKLFFSRTITDPTNPWIAVIFIPLLVGIILLALAFQNYHQNVRVQNLFERLSLHRKPFSILFLLGVNTFVFIISRMADMDDALINLAMSGFGLLFYGILLVFLIFTIRERRKNEQDGKDHFLSVAILIISVTWLFMILTRIGLQPDQAFWNVAGVPMMWVSLAGIILLILLLDQLGSWIHTKFPRKLDHKLQVLLEVFLVLTIWLCASLIWIKTPYSNSYFLQGPNPPSGHYWPKSDARLMDLGGQYLIIGAKLETPYFTEKPFYALFLGLLHYFFGQSYQTISNIQILFLALIPVVLYYLGKQLSSMLFGLMVAIFAIIKEATAILFTYKISVSNSRLMMTELPSALLLIIVTVLVFNWLRSKESHLDVPLLAGTAIGVASYVRSNNLFVFFVLLFFVIFISVKNMRKRWSQIGLFFLGAVIAILPWMVYSQITYGIDPITRKIDAALSTRFNVPDPEDRDEEPLVPIDPLPDPTLTPTEPKSILMPDKPSGRSFTVLALSNEPSAIHVSTYQPAKSYFPRYTARFSSTNIDEPTSSTSSVIYQEESQPEDRRESKAVKIIGHFLNNQVKALFVLPFQMYPARPTTILEQAYWNEPVDWSGEMPAEHLVAFVCNLLLISLGISYAWKNFHWAGLVPLVIEMAYYLSNALVRTSGSRYLVAVDWAVYLYFLLGLWAILRSSHLLSLTASDQKIPRNYPNQGFWVSLVLCLLTGLSLPSLNLAFPALYNNESKAAVFSKLPLSKIETEIGITPDDMQSFYEKPGSVFLFGREIYPSYLEMDRVPGGKALTFTLLTPDLYDIVIPYGIRLTEDLPAGEDMIVVGCKSADNKQIIAYMGYFFQSDKLVWSTSTTFNGICP